MSSENKEGLDVEEILLLENLTYLPVGEDGISKPLDEYATVGELVTELQNSNLDLKYEYTTGVTGEEWNEIIDAVSSNPELCRMEIKATSDNSTVEGVTGTSVIFVDETTDTAVVAFRGTESDEWADNFVAGGSTNAEDGVSTEQQEKALEWYQSEYKRLGLEEYEVIVTGHSKGGNKAKYIAIMDDTVDRCVSYDGQGFSDDFIFKYYERILQREAIIENHNIDYDFVNILLNDVGTTTYYKGYNYGDGGLIQAHAPNAFFNFDREEGNRLVVSEDGQAKEMMILDGFLNSYLRSLSAKEKEDALFIIGKIVEGAFNGEKMGFYTEILLDEEYQDDLAYLIAYIIKYEQSVPEFEQALNDICEEFGMNELQIILEGVDAVLESEYFDQIAQGLEVASYGLAYLLWSNAQLLTSAILGNFLTFRDFLSLASIATQVNEALAEITINDNSGLDIEANQLSNIISGSVKYFEIVLSKLWAVVHILFNCGEILNGAFHMLEDIIDKRFCGKDKVEYLLKVVEYQMRHENKECTQLAETLADILKLYENIEEELSGIVKK